MDEQQLVHVVAAELVDRYGARAIAQIDYHIEEARRRGDDLSVEAWQDIRAVAASRVAEIVRPRPAAERARATRRRTKPDARVLIVDDDPDVLEALETILSRDGHVIETASGSREALNAIERDTTLDLLVTDIVMPRVDGLCLAREARLRLPSLKVLLLTGYAEKLAPQQTSTPAFDKVLEKPIMPDVLCREVAALLS